MNNGKWVVWGVGVGVLGVNLFAGCAPTITVSRDDEPGGAAGLEDPGGNLGGSVGVEKGGTGGSNPGDGSGGSAIAGGRGGSGGDAVAAGTGGTDIFHGMAGTGSVTPPDDCPCSRRPSSPVSPDCPRGAGTSMTTIVGPDGGDATLGGTPSTIGVPFRVHVAAGSLDGKTKLDLSETTLSPPSGLFDVSPVYRVEPDGLEFVNGGQVSVPWTVPSGFVPEGIAIYYSELPQGPWMRLEDSYQNAGFEQATITRSGYFVAAYPPTPELASCPTSPVLDFSTVDCGNTDPEVLFQKGCAKSFCHGANFVAGLDLRTDPGLATRLLDVPARFDSIPCPDDVTQNCIPDTCPSGALLVDSVNPERSWMLAKLSSATDGCGDLMPPSSGASTADYPCYLAIISAIAALPK